MATVNLTVAYKTIASLDLEIDLDIYYPAHARGAPVLLFFHGNGSPVQGSRFDVPEEILGVVSRSNWVLVSADYRLAPQVGINDIYEDVKDCFEFIRDPQGLSRFLPNGTIDLERVAVSGNGGGGYLALLAGLHLRPKPQAVLALSPITDPFNRFFTTQRPWGEVYNGDSDENTVKASLEPLLSPNGQVKANYVHTDEDEQYPLRQQMYAHMLHRGDLPNLLGIKGRKDPENDKWCVARQLKVSAGPPYFDSALPPTFLMHGWADKQVSVAQSDSVFQMLKAILGKAKFEQYNQFERLKGWEHASEDEKSEYMDRMYRFVQSWI
jgi:acetyl esterase/lipase